jgi:ATP-dependent protease ClpP protease subunit
MKKRKKKMVELTMDGLKVIEETKEDIIEKNPVHFLTGELAEENISKAIEWIVSENISKNAEWLTLYINSNGGDLCHSFALIDIMYNSAIPIKTIGIGQIMSAAFLIFIAGTERLIGQHTSIMIHQHSDTYEGRYHDLKSRMIESKNNNDRMISVIEDFSELKPATIKSKFLAESDYWLTASDMITYKLADGIF